MTIIFCRGRLNGEARAAEQKWRYIVVCGRSAGARLKFAAIDAISSATPKPVKPTPTPTFQRDFALCRTSKSRRSESQNVTKTREKNRIAHHETPARAAAAETAPKTNAQLTRRYSFCRYVSPVARIESAPRSSSAVSASRCLMRRVGLLRALQSQHPVLNYDTHFLVATIFGYFELLPSDFGNSNARSSGASMRRAVATAPTRRFDRTAFQVNSSTPISRKVRRRNHAFRIKSRNGSLAGKSEWIKFTY